MSVNIKKKSNNHRMIQQLSFHEQQTIQTTSNQDLDPRPCADNVHACVLPHEMVDIEPGEILPVRLPGFLEIFGFPESYQV